MEAVKNVVVDLHRGLGNRLLPFLSGLRMAVSAGAEFCFCWNRYSPPWTVPPPPDPCYAFDVGFQDVWRMRPEWEETTPLQLARRIGRGPQRGLFFWDRPTLFGKGSREAFRLLQPSPEVERRADALLARTGDCFLGLSVRTFCAWKPSLEKSPPEWFSSRSARLLARSSFTSVFLSCDEESVRDRLCRSLEKASVPIVFAEKKSPYSSPESILDAAADLWTLSRASHRLGPVGSTLILAAHCLRSRPDSPTQTAEGYFSLEGL